MEYQTVKFTAKLNDTIRMKNRGLMIDENLVTGWHIVGKNYALYNQFGYRVTSLCFKTEQDAVSFAECFRELYGEYLILWHEDQRAKIPELTRWTIDNGLVLLDTIESLVGEPISFDQFAEAYHARLDF